MAVERMTVVFPKEKQPALRAVAKRLGYTAKHGPLAGKGSISALLLGIADGELLVVPARPAAEAVDAVRRKDEEDG